MLRDRLARIGDGLFFFLIAFIFVIDLTGGFRIGRGWYRLSATNPSHVLMVAAGVLVARHLLVRRPSLRDRLTARRLSRPPSPWASLQLDWPGWRDWAAVLVFMTAATVVLLKDQVWLVTGIPDRGDPLFSMWRLAWVAHQIVADPLRLFDANIFYPAEKTLAYSDATILPGLLVMPFLGAGVPVALVHGWVYIASFILAGVAMFLLARAVTRQSAPSVLAGVLFAFYPYRFSTYSHLEMQGIFLMPLALLFLLRLLQEGRTRDGALLGLAVALQTLWSLYLGAYLAVALAVICVFRWLAGHFEFRRRLVGLGAAVVVAAALVGPYSWPYWAARETVGTRQHDEVRLFSARPIDFFNINEINRLHGPWLHRPLTAERQLFPGVTALALSIPALAPPVAPIAAACAAGVLFGFDATLGLRGASFARLYHTAPPFRAFRVPARFGMVIGLFISLLAGLGLARWLRRRSRRTGAIVSAIVIGLALFELRPGLELTPMPTDPEPIYAALPDNGRAVIVDLPMPLSLGDYWIDPTYLYYSTFHWNRLLNGYSGFIPDWYPRLMVASREFPSPESIDIFRQRGAEFVVVHEEFYGPDQYRDVTSALVGRDDVQLIGARRSAAGESRLYRIKP